MSSLTFPEQIVQFLRSNSGQFAAKTIARATNLERRKVNQMLYGILLRDGKVICDASSHPPLWSYPVKNTQDMDETDEDEKHVKTVVFVDLGNIHDVLQHLENYADECNVYAFADRAFNGFGVNPSPKNKNIRVCQTKDEHKNAADVEMIWTAAEIVMNTDPKAAYKVRFIIFTKDNGFRSLKTILERYDVVEDVIFAQTWQEAREFIE